MTPLHLAWVGLAGLSAATTAVAVFGLANPWSGILILVFAWAKVRLILLWYLELADVPRWRSGILLGLAVFMLLIFALYLIAWAS
ncbi:MAG: cytochrome C oxidase subunit IV family protein [Rhizobiaceae bacterium]